MTALRRLLSDGNRLVGGRQDAAASASTDRWAAIGIGSSGHAPAHVVLGSASAIAPLPGTAMFGCGEGADAIWLASLDWQVTAIDVSTVALERY